MLQRDLRRHGNLPLRKLRRHVLWLLLATGGSLPQLFSRAQQTVLEVREPGVCARRLQKEDVPDVFRKMLSAVKDIAMKRRSFLSSLLVAPVPLISNPAASKLPFSCICNVGSHYAQLRFESGAAARFVFLEFAGLCWGELNWRLLSIPFDSRRKWEKEDMKKNLDMVEKEESFSVDVYSEQSRTAVFELCSRYGVDIEFFNEPTLKDGRTAHEFSTDLKKQWKAYTYKNLPMNDAVSRFNREVESLAKISRERKDCKSSQHKRTSS